MRTLASVKNSFPLLTVFDIGRKNLERLENAVTTFILASLRFSCDRDFPYRPDFLTAYAPEIAALPNITPNGACYAKRETVLEFNLMHRELANACRDSGVLQHLRMLTPSSLRVMIGTSTRDKEARPYSTAKLHSDAWIGHQSDGIASLFVMGDVESTRLEFFEPVDPSAKFFDELTDYEQGHQRYRDLLPYPVKPTPGDLYLFDRLALHQTVRAQGGIRLSIGFGYVVDNPASRSNNMAPVAFDYLSCDEWVNIGVNSIQVFDESMADLRELYGTPRTEASKRRYAPSRMISLWPKQ